MRKLASIVTLLMTTCLLAQNAGDIVITEIMIDPQGPSEQNREWFEIYNTTNTAININGWTIVDNSTSSRNHLINSPSPVLVPALSYAVLAYNIDPTVTVPLQNVIYVYGAPTGGSSNGRPTWNNESTYSGTPPSSTTADGPGLRTPTGVLIDEIKYGFGYSGLPAWPAQGTPQAVSYQLNANALNAASNDAAANWAASTNVFGVIGSNSYFGTPGTANFGFNSGLLNPGNIIITELMIDPDGTEADTEYFELYNTTSAAIDVQGWVLEDVSSSSRNHTIATSVIIPATSYALFAANGVATANGGLTNIAYIYGNPTGNGFPRFNNENSFSTTNNLDGLILRTNSGLEMDAVRYDYGFSGIGLPATNSGSGSSIELGLSHFSSTDNDLASSWAQAINSYGNDLGTPGSANLFDRVFTYDNAWVAGNPDGITNALADVNVINGTASFSSTTTLRNLTIAMGSAMNSSSMLAFNGNLVINGSINHTSGVFKLTGDESQQINGTGVLNIDNLSIENSEQVVNNGIINIFNTLNVTRGSLDNTGSVTLKNTAVRTAVINTLPAGTSLDGNYTIERYIPATTANPQSRAFRFLASPVTSVTSIFANWQENGAFVPGRGTHITGSMGAVGVVDTMTGFDQTATGSPSFFTYSNTTTQVWTPVTSTNASGDILEPMNAYRLFVRGDRDAARLASAINGNATTLSSTGSLASASIEQTYPVNANDFIFVGNPYQAPVNMETVLASSDNVNNNVVYYWDPNLGGLTGRGAYTTVSGFAGGGTATALPASPNTKYIQPGQAAFIQSSTGNAIVRFRESDKGTSTNLAAGTVFSQPNAGSEQITVSLYDTASFNAGSTPADAVQLRFNSTYTNGLDASDILKLHNLYESLSLTTHNGNSFAILSENTVQHGAIYPLDFTNQSVNAYTFKLDLSNFLGFNVYLNDAFLNTRTVLNNGSTNSVNITVNPNDLSSAENRFALLFESTTLSTNDVSINKFSIYPNPVSGTAFFINLNNSNSASITIVNALGQQVYENKLASSLTSVNPVDWKTGIYFVNIKSNGNEQTLKLIIK